MTQVARKIEVRMMPKQSPLDVCLAIWLDWQRRKDVSLDWRGKSAILESDACADSQQLYDRMDNVVGEAVEAMVLSLPTHLLWAMHRRCGLAKVWRFPSLVFADVLVQAELELEKKLKNNIATRIFFN